MKAVKSFCNVTWVKMVVCLAIAAAATISNTGCDQGGEGSSWIRDCEEMFQLSGRTCFQ